MINQIDLNAFIWHNLFVQINLEPFSGISYKNTHQIFASLFL